MTSLWQEMFNNPSPVEFTQSDWNRAWDWIFEDKETATLKLSLCRRHSLLLRRQGVTQSSIMAVTGIWKRQTMTKCLPIRKTSP